jgi:hypothetical protein
MAPEKKIKIRHSAHSERAMKMQRILERNPVALDVNYENISDTAPWERDSARDSETLPSHRATAQ